MVIISIESSDVCTTLDQIKGYNYSQIVHINRNTPATKITSYKNPPLTKFGWLLVCDVGVSDTVCGLMRCADNNIYLFTVNTVHQKDELVNELNRRCVVINKIVDNRRPQKDVVVDWIISQVNTDKSTAEYIYNRSKGYMKQIVYNVGLLSALNSVRKDDVRKYTKGSDNDSPLVLVNHLAGIERIDKSRAVRIIYKYRYAKDFLFKFLTSTLKEYIDVFDMMYSGELTMENHLEIHSDKNSRISGINKYRLTKILESFSKISLDRLYYMYANIKKLGVNFSIHKLILLTKL